MGNVSHGRRIALALTFAVTVGATAVAAAPAPTVSAGAGPCGPLGELIGYQLNDRCDFNAGVDPMNVPLGTAVASLSKAGVFATTLTCRNGTVLPVVAAPNQLLVSAANPNRLAFALRTVRRRLDNLVVGDPRPVNALAARLFLRPGTLTLPFLRRVVPALQGPGWSADLNYLEPAQPHNGFRPGDNPRRASAPLAGRGGQLSVLVVDSPSQNNRHPEAPDVVLSTIGPAAVYDVDGNRLIDEDHGHGVFVASLVKRLAPQATVVLAGVNGRQIPRLARWSPMMFSDADLIKSMGDAFGLSPGGTAVRRSFHIVNLSLGGAGCDGIGSRLPLGRFMRDLAGLAARHTRVAPRYVAAAGNNGGDVKHFPAAWRDKLTIEGAAKAVDLALGGGGSPTAAGNEIRQIQALLQGRTIAVGSWTGGVRDPFSNCGKWVNGVADGARTVSRYPSSTSWARWSGTSFATARVSAVLALGGNPGDVDVAESIGAC